MNTKQEETLCITKQMIEDLYIVAEVYNISINEVIKTFIGDEENCNIEITA